MLKARRCACLLTCVALASSPSMPACAAGRNLVAGTWIMVSARADPGGRNEPLFSPHPSGLLIFTEDLHFADVLVDPDVPGFASSDRAGGTEAEDKAVVARDLALYGTYTVDEQGRFATEHVTASTFPNWNGLERDTRTITEAVQGDTMTERLQDPGGPRIVIVWRRARRTRSQDKPPGVLEEAGRASRHRPAADRVSGRRETSRNSLPAKPQ